MKKFIILFILLVLTAMTAEAKYRRVITAPEAVTSVNLNQSALKAHEVILSDTATTVHFSITYSKDYRFRFAKDSYLMDERGHRYPLRSAEGIQLDFWNEASEAGTTNFTMHFKPLPEKIQVFDFIEGDTPNAFMLLGIHDSSQPITMPTMEELAAANPVKLPKGWFKTDSITVRGRIENYDEEQLQFQQLECLWSDIFEPDTQKQRIDVELDGTFCLTFQTSHPVLSSLSGMMACVGSYDIPFFACPGETIDITVKTDSNGNPHCFYRNGSSRTAARFFQSRLPVRSCVSRLYHHRDNEKEIDLATEAIESEMAFYLQSMGRRHHFTPLEMQLAIAEFHSAMAELYLRLTDDLEVTTTHFEPLRHIDFDTPLLWASAQFHSLLIDLPGLSYYDDIQWKGLHERNKPYYATLENEQKRLANILEAVRHMTCDNRNNLLAQLCIYHDMLREFDDWKEHEEFASIYLSLFTDPCIRKKAEAFFEKKRTEALKNS